MSFHARALSSFKLLAVVATLGAWSAPARADEFCTFPPHPGDSGVTCDDLHVFARYLDGLTAEEYDILKRLAERIFQRINAAGDTLTAEQIHLIYKDGVLDMRAGLGDARTQEILAFEVMGAMRTAPQISAADVWLDHVVSLPISGLVYGYEGPEAQANVGSAVLKLGFALVGASAGFGFAGPAGAVAGMGAGAAFGEALSEGLGINDEPDSGGGSGSSGS